MKKKTLLVKILSVFTVFAMLMTICPALSSRVGAYSYRAYGIDTSQWQGDVDWCAVKAAGIDFVIMRVGTSKSVTGGTLDPKFEQNYAGAKLAGLNVGVYFYSCAMNTTQAKTEAANVLKWIAGKRFEYPIYIDMEDAVQLSLTTAERTNICVAFNTVLENAGYMTGVYANTNWLTNYLDRATISSRYSLWEAAWTKSGTDEADKSSVRNLWQYTDSGSVSGISGAVDRDVSYIDYPTLIRSRGLNGFSENSPKDTVRGYYKTTDNLNLRSGAGTSNSIITTIPAGTQISLLGKNADGSWANVVYGSKTGWVSTSYLTFVRYFNYTVNYDLNHKDATGSAPSVTACENEKTAVASSSVTANGVSPIGWSLKRSSDNSWYVEGAGWVADSNISNHTKKLYGTGSSLTFDSTIINASASDDTYTFCAEWPAAANFKGVGYYKVTSANAVITDSVSDGNVRATVPQGTLLPVTKVSDDGVFGYVTYRIISGWMSLYDLQYSSDIVYTVRYETDGKSIGDLPSKTLSYGDSVTVEGEGLSEEGKTFIGWNLKRQSDKAWYTPGGEWSSDADEKALLLPGDSFTVDESSINYSIGNDTFILTAVWEKHGMTGDVDENGEINTLDILLIRKYLVSLVSENEINVLNADVDHNGTINSLDILIIRKYIVGLIETLE